MPRSSLTELLFALAFALVTTFVAGSLITTGFGQQLLVVESTNDTVMAFDPFDGSLTNPVFIDLTTAGGVKVPATPV